MPRSESVLKLNTHRMNAPDSLRIFMRPFPCADIAKAVPVANALVVPIVAVAVPNV